MIINDFRYVISCYGCGQIISYTNYNFKPGEKMDIFRHMIYTPDGNPVAANDRVECKCAPRRPRLQIKNNKAYVRP